MKNVDMHRFMVIQVNHKSELSVLRQHARHIQIMPNQLRFVKNLMKIWIIKTDFQADNLFSNQHLTYKAEQPSEAIIFWLTPGYRWLLDTEDSIGGALTSIDFDIRYSRIANVNKIQFTIFCKSCPCRLKKKYGKTVQYRCNYSAIKIKQAFVCRGLTIARNFWFGAIEQCNRRLIILTTDKKGG